MRQKDVDGPRMANSVDPDQAAPLLLNTENNTRTQAFSVAVGNLQRQQWDPYWDYIHTTKSLPNLINPTTVMILSFWTDAWANSAVPEWQTV